MTAVLGIDLGTSFIKICSFDQGTGQVIPLKFDNNEITMPSVVGVSVDKSEVRVGFMANKFSPGFHTIRESKRLIGKKYESMKVKEKQDVYDKLGYQVAESDDGKVVIRFLESTSSGNSTAIYDYDPTLVAADLLKKVKEFIQSKTKQDFSVVVTVPAAYSFRQKEATLEACKIAQLNVLKLIPEPSAAALAYLKGNHLKNFKEGAYLVFDYGGGTLDCSIVEILKNRIDVKCVLGDMFCGGADIDKCLMDLITIKIKEKEGIDPVGEIDHLDKKKMTKQLKNLSKIRDAAVSCKTRLSTNEKHTFILELDFEGDFLEPQLTITREEFQKRLEISKIEVKVIKVLEDCKNALQEYTKLPLINVLLAGGSSKNFIVRKWIEKVFPNVEVFGDLDLDTLIAKGAVYTGLDILNNKDSIVMKDVIPCDLGVETVGPAFSPIVPKFTTVPCKRSNFYTNYVDSQSSVVINTLEGFKENGFSGCTSINIFKIPITPKPKGESSIEVEFKVTENGILEVEAFDTSNVNYRGSVKIEMFDKRTKLEIEELSKRTCICQPLARETQEAVVISRNDVKVVRETDEKKKKEFFAKFKKVIQFKDKFIKKDIN